MSDVKVGDRVFSRVDPDHKGTVVRLYEFGSFVLRDWADVKWDRVVLPKQFPDVTGIPVDGLEKVNV